MPPKFDVGTKVKVYFRTPISGGSRLRVITWLSGGLLTNDADGVYLGEDARHPAVFIPREMVALVILEEADL